MEHKPPPLQPGSEAFALLGPPGPPLNAATGICMLKLILFPPHPFSLSTSPLLKIDGVLVGEQHTQLFLLFVWQYSANHFAGAL